MKKNDDNHTLCFLEMTFRKCVRHVINVLSAYPTNLTSDVGSSTSTSACLTYMRILSPYQNLTTHNQNHILTNIKLHQNRI